MNYTPEEIAEISERAVAEGNVFTGRSASYVQLNEDWGYKWYKTRGMSERTYSHHLRAESLGFGPKVGCCIQTQIGVDHVWGYIIEHVTTADSLALKELGYERYDQLKTPDEYKFDAIEKILPQFKDDIRYLRQKVRENGYRWMDDHSGNWGWTKQGVPVRIDFDDE